MQFASVQFDLYVKYMHSITCKSRRETVSIFEPSDRHDHVCKKKKKNEWATKFRNLCEISTVIFCLKFSKFAQRPSKFGNQPWDSWWALLKRGRQIFVIFVKFRRCSKGLNFRNLEGPEAHWTCGIAANLSCLGGVAVGTSVMWSVSQKRFSRF